MTYNIEKYRHTSFPMALILIICMHTITNQIFESENADCVCLTNFADHPRITMVIIIPLKFQHCIILPK